ncbi:MAG: UDP-N-acetylmuramoyl-L-alanyl-D-glutamate--2,6-diaminopimelate ligase, partial [Odoribacter sp.]|nr:UDP-N-acetylmuramoyl-L-alanyl-D-glutamate--2,6-diaminopimelate ligase [Odoribacter sp.]
MEKLKDLLKGVAYEAVHGDVEIPVNTVHFDSRKVGKNDVFVAQRGVSADGHAFIQKAIEAGVTGVVCEEFPAMLAEGVCYVKVADSSEALG